MKLLTKLIQTSKAKIFIIGGLPIDWNITHLKSIDFPGEFDLLGRLSEITEEQILANIVGRGFNNYKVCQKLSQQPQYEMYWVRYPDGSHKNFDTKDECYAHALKMELLSLIESEVCLKNPYGNEKQFYYGEQGMTNEEFDEKVTQYKSAEEQVFHNPILFVDYKK